jgi:hypothetical protein
VIAIVNTVRVFVKLVFLSVAGRNPDMINAYLKSGYPKG